MQTISIYKKLGGIKVQEGFIWNIFLNTGRIDFYLLYKDYKLEENEEKTHKNFFLDEEINAIILR
jgi:hypothetical protein